MSSNGKGTSISLGQAVENAILAVASGRTKRETMERMGNALRLTKAMVSDIEALRDELGTAIRVAAEVSGWRPVRIEVPLGQDTVAFKLEDANGVEIPFVSPRQLIALVPKKLEGPLKVTLRKGDGRELWAKLTVPEEDGKPLGRSSLEPAGELSETMKYPCQSSVKTKAT
jgi:hypothetical protein